MKVVPLLGKFQAKHPKVDVSVSITDRYVNLVDEGVDVAVRFGTLDDSTLIARPLVNARRCVVGTPAYFAKYGRPRTLSDLTQHNCLPLTYHETRRSRQWKFQHALEGQPFSPKGSMTFNDGYALYTAVQAGFGLGQIHDYYVEADIASGLLVPVLEEFEPEADTISIVFPQARHLSPRVRVFVDFLVAAFQ